MATNEEAHQNPHDQGEYEHPALIVDPAQLPQKDKSQELKKNSPQQSGPALQHVKRWSRKHVTPMNVLTLVIAVAAWEQFYVTQGQLRVMRGQLEATDRPWIEITKADVKEFSFVNRVDNGKSILHAAINLVI